MDDSPVQALRKKKNASMRVAIDLVEKKIASACVSAGNTGALMAISHFVLKTLPGIDRCAIIAAFPVLGGGHVRLLDLGANVDSTSQQLYQFAIMGSVAVSVLDGIEKPQVALLNVGTEDIKGNEQVKGAALLLQQSKVLNYKGYVEGDQIFKNVADVIVCDGFVGNVTLKSCEGLAGMIMGHVRHVFERSIANRCVGLLAKPILKRVALELDTKQHNGANLLGLRGIVIKSHGGADIASFVSAIENAKCSVENSLLSLIQERITLLLQEERV